MYSELLPGVFNLTKSFHLVFCSLLFKTKKKETCSCRDLPGLGVVRGSYFAKITALNCACMFC